jgi:hypothetical protein
MVDEWGNRINMGIELTELWIPFDSVKARPIGEPKLTAFANKAAPYNVNAAPVERALRAPLSKRLALASDGTDLVWAFKDPADAKRCLVLRTPWKSDVAALEPPIRVAAIPCSELEENNAHVAVGCGYFGATTIEGRGLVLRLKDGAMFHFPKLCAPLDMSIPCRTRVMGFTCSEAFFAVGGIESNVIRVPLDAMPSPAMPEEPPRPFDEPDAGDATAGDGGALDAGRARDGG